MSNLTTLPLGTPGPAIHLAETLDIVAAQPKAHVTFQIPVIFQAVTSGPSLLRIELETMLSGSVLQTQLVTLSHTGTERLPEPYKLRSTIRRIRERMRTLYEPGSSAILTSRQILL